MTLNLQPPLRDPATASAPSFTDGDWGTLDLAVLGQNQEMAPSFRSCGQGRQTACRPDCQPSSVCPRTRLQGGLFLLMAPMPASLLQGQTVLSGIACSGMFLISNPIKTDGEFMEYIDFDMISLETEIASPIEHHNPQAMIPVQHL